MKEIIRNASIEAMRRGACVGLDDVKTLEDANLASNNHAILYVLRGLDVWFDLDTLKQAILQEEDSLLHVAVSSYGGERWRSLPREVFDVLTSYILSKRSVPAPTPFISTVTAVLNDIVVPSLFLSPSSSGGQRLQFTKHAPSIEVIDASRAKQKAGKTWGSVQTNRRIKPKEVYCFSVQIVLSPKSHTFLGVTTDMANLKTYVGGDKEGWGVIGTKAVWFGREKRRSYGEGENGQKARQLSRVARNLIR
jgi:hypothetical protein